MAVAETQHQDLWQRAELACAAVGNDRRYVERVLTAAERFVAGHPLARIIDSTLSFR